MIILGLLRTRPESSAAELARETGLSRDGIVWNLRKLQAEGRLRRVGPARGGRWDVLS